VAIFMELFKEFLASDLDFVWIRDPQVSDGGNWEFFESSFDDCEADFLATQIRTYGEEPDWHAWTSLMTPENIVLVEENKIAALLPLLRLSRAAAEIILEGIEAGWKGHPETLFPTLVKQAGLSIEDIGGNGSFTPKERGGKWYDERTWHWHGPVIHVPGMLHFPVAIQTRGFAGGRLAEVTKVVKKKMTTGVSSLPKLLYISPVGAGGKLMMAKTLDVFKKAGADLLLLQYDQAELSLPQEARVIRDRASKWQLAARHLHPDQIVDYDYVFFWDDDLDTTGFDPQRFVSLMKHNRLEMAQPAIQSEFPLSHAITQQQQCPPPLRGMNGKDHPIVGRLTNFVEIMAAVYTREAWREIHGYVDPLSWSGWGLDFVPLGRKGIVDVMPVVHTRPVQSGNSEAVDEFKTFINNHGLIAHPAVNQGWLFE
jgi:Protein of unknown function (DUF707)